MILRGSVFSRILGMDTGLAVIGPKDMPPEGASRVAYVLHGLSGNNATWADYTMLPEYARHGTTLYVLPEAGRGFYTDMRYGHRYFSYITEELPQLVAAVFHIRSARENTLVMGGSMGGYGALKAALARPDVFGACAAFASGCLFLRENMTLYKQPGEREKFVEQYGSQLEHDFVAAFGPELDPEPYDDLPTLAHKVLPGQRPDLYISCGTQDPFYHDHTRFAALLRSLGYAPTVEDWDAGHEFAFFNESIRRAIAHFAL